MNERNYINFDLVIEQKGDRYLARVISSPAGQAEVEFDELFSPLELENFVLRMGRPQRGMRRIESTEMATIKNFGTRLFKTVFKDDVYACYLRSIDDTLNQNKGLRIRLRINVPEFHDLPWEFLYNPQFDQFLALSKDTPIIRYIELPYSTRALPVKTPMKILVMISSPDGYPALDIHKEWDKLNRSLKPLIDQGLVILEQIENPTLSALQKKLRQDQVHIFHFIGHGKYFEDKQDGMLLLEDEDRRGRPTSGQHLGAILHDHHQLRLVVLNACEGARTSSEDPYAGVAQTLVRQGIPAVLAMQFEIFEDAAMTLAQEFYSAIVDGYPVDAALSEARKAIFASNNDVEWGTPVLFMRTPNGVLFRPETPEEKVARLAAEREAAEKAAREKAKREAEQERARKEHLSQLNRLYDQAKIQIEQRDWPAVIEFLLHIKGIEPDFRDVPALLQQAEAEKEREDKIAELLLLGKDLIQNEDWSKAVQVLNQLLEMAPEHEEAGQLLAKTEAEIKLEKESREKQAHLEKFYNQGSQNFSRRDWATAIEFFSEIQQIEPDYRDVSDLLEQAEKEKDREDKTAELLLLGKDLIQNENWSKAINVLSQLLEITPEHEKAGQLLAKAEAEIKLEKESREKQAHLEKYYKQANQKFSKQDWEAAIEFLTEIEQIEPGFRDVKKLLNQAQTEKVQENKISSLVSKGKKHLENQEWAQAIRFFEQALGLDSKNKDVQSLLKQAQNGEKVEDLLNAAQVHMASEQWSQAIIQFQAILELEPTHTEARRQLDKAKEGSENQKKILVEAGKRTSRTTKPSSLPEEIKPIKPGSHPDETKPQKKPRNLPK